ncbi:MAG: HAMP domain-containing sensor histidine kinase [Ignavibacteriales bacterium]|nr:HAMP domain-containing sensor histidine kinase [Ignavibacteriales bacterium]
MSIVENRAADAEIIKSLKIASAISIIAGSWSLLFEIFYFHFFKVDIYFARVLFTLIALTIFFLSFKNISQRLTTILVHLLIISLISSFIYTIYKIPNTLFINSQILSLLIFTTALIFSWEVKNQIIVAIYYNLLFAGSIIFNGSNIFFLPNLFSITIFVSLISLLSIVASAVNYSRRKIYKSKAEEVNFIFNSIPIGICRTDGFGNILTQNKFLAFLLGAEQIKKKSNIVELISDSKFSEYFSQINYSGADAREVSVNYKNEEDKMIYLRVISKYKSTESGNKNIDFIIKDESNEVLARNEQKEIALKLLNETKEKEHFAQMRILEKNQKIQLLAKINHEVRTPLNAILMFQQMIEEDILRSMEEVKKYSKSVKTAVGHLLNTIDNFIYYAKIETGKMENEMALFNIQEEIEDIIQLLKPLALGKCIGLSLILEKSSRILAYSDVKKYRQIMTNLIANSIKFTRTGNINVILNNRHLDDDQYEIITKIEDTGIGIAKDKLTDIFNPFVSLNEDNSERYSGGLGLAICKEFIQILEGKIEITSVVGQGSEFVVTIPYQYDFSKINAKSF